MHNTVLSKYQYVYDMFYFIYRFSWVKHIVVTVSQQYKDVMDELVKTYNFNKVIVALGASARHRSIYNGLKTLGSCKALYMILLN